MILLGGRGRSMTCLGGYAKKLWAALIGERCLMKGGARKTGSASGRSGTRPTVRYCLPIYLVESTTELFFSIEPDAGIVNFYQEKVLSFFFQTSIRSFICRTH